MHQIRRTWRCHFLNLFIIYLGNYFAIALVDTTLTDSTQQFAIINAFAGCNIRVVNFRGVNVNYQGLKEPILLIRYLSHCEKRLVFPFELGKAYPALSEQNTSTCQNTNSGKANLPSDHVAISYVQQTLSDSFQLKSKNQPCEANVFLDPPTERDSPQLYTRAFYWINNRHSHLRMNSGKATATRHWQIVLKNWISTDLEKNIETQMWKLDHLNTVPMISLLICNLTADSICGNEKDVKKWIAGVFFDYEMSRLSVTVLIWEYPSLSLTTLCPYCDPCNSLKTIPLQSKMIPTSKTELQNIVNESQQLNPVPYSVRVALKQASQKNFQTNQLKQVDVLKYIQQISIESGMSGLNFAADKHLTTLLLTRSANITFCNTGNCEWENVITDSCSPKATTNSHPAFRPMILPTHSRYPSLLQDFRLVTFINQLGFVSCHKKQMHWTNQLTELVSPFDTPTWFLILTICLIVSWIAKLSVNERIYSGNAGLLNITFSLFWSILDQTNSIFKTKSITSKCSLYCCVFCLPISWMYLSTLYKGENVTRLTADPPLIRFDTFRMLDEHEFKIYSRRYNLKTFHNKKYFNVSELDKVQKQHGSIIAHEALPFVSQLWYQLMIGLRPFGTVQLSLNLLKDEIPKQIWKYINNSAMLPDYGPGIQENVSTIINLHMKMCNKSSVILHRSSAIKLHTVLKQMGKPSFVGKDKILQSFWGYSFLGYFPSKLFLRGSHIFEAGVFGWWQNFFEYILVLKTSVHGKRLMASYKQNGTSEISKNKTAPIILSLIPGFGLLVSITVFIFAEIQAIRKALAIFSRSFHDAAKLFQRVRKCMFKLNVENDNVISIMVQPKVKNNG